MRQQQGQLKWQDNKIFLCADLRIIDQLWVKHSQGKFGFSVQKKIWQKCGSPTVYNTVQQNTNWEKYWEKFYEAVGWKKKGFLGMKSDWVGVEELTFDTSAPDGHLPGHIHLRRGVGRDFISHGDW